MGSWSCGLGDCDAIFEGVQDLLEHQIVSHPAVECEICGETVPDGFFAIRHVFTEHTRAKYVRHYDGDADAIRYRENLIEEVEDLVDPDTILDHVETEGALGTETSAVSAGD